MEQLLVELEDTYPMVDNIEQSVSQYPMQEDGQHPHPHDQSSNAPSSSCASQPTVSSPALAEFRNQHTGAHLERASSPDTTGGEQEHSSSDETYEPSNSPMDYETPVDLRTGVKWSGSSPTACSEIPEESQLEAPHWVKHPNLL